MKEKSDIMRKLLDAMLLKKHGNKGSEKESSDNGIEEKLDNQKSDNLSDHIFSSNQSFQIVRKRIVKKRH